MESKRSIHQVFRINRKLTREELASLEVYNIIDAGGLPEDYYYHLKLDEISPAEKEVLEARFSLRFKETIEYKLESRFPTHEFKQ